MVMLSTDSLTFETCLKGCHAYGNSDLLHESYVSSLSGMCDIDGRREWMLFECLILVIITLLVNFHCCHIEWGDTFMIP